MARGRSFSSLVLASALLAACAAPAPVEPGPGEYYYTPRQKGAAALSGGAGYHGSVLKQAPAADPLAGTAAKPARAAPGKLPLPVGYPLLPGDDSLWPTLTRQQQERAMQFLKDGSTIRASLRTD